MVHTSILSDMGLHRVPTSSWDESECPDHLTSWLKSPQPSSKRVAMREWRLRSSICATSLLWWHVQQSHVGVKARQFSSVARPDGANYNSTKNMADRATAFKPASPVHSSRKKNVATATELIPQSTGNSQWWLETTAQDAKKRKEKLKF